MTKARSRRVASSPRIGLRAFPRMGRRAAMLLSWLGSMGLLLCVAAATAALILLPDLASRKADVEELLSQRTHLRVQAGSLVPYWDFLHPGLRARDVRIASPDTGTEAMRFEEVRMSVAWLPLLTGNLIANRLVIVGPRLAFERLPSGQLRVRGMDATDAATPEEQERAVRALFRVSDIAIEKGELRWFDTRAGEAPLSLSDVRLRLRNDGNRHRLDLTARFPDALCRACEFSADIKGNPFADDTDWTGELFIRAQALELARLPALAREFLPAGLRGLIDVRATSVWRAARPVWAEGTLQVTDFFVPVKGFAPVEAHSAEATLRWKSWDDLQSWRLELDDLRVGLARSVWDAGKFKLVRENATLGLAIDHVRLEDISQLAARNAGAHSLMHIASVLNARGWLDGFNLSLQGPLDAPQDVGASGTLRGVSWRPWEKIPGIEALSGSFRFDARGGEASLSTGRGVLAMPRVFAANLEVNQLTAQARWTRTDADWDIRLANLSALTPDGRAWGNAEIRIPHPGSPGYDEGLRLKLRTEASDANGAHTGRYLPLILNASLRAWLGNAIRAGTVTQAKVIFDGPVRKFPFRGGEGEFEAGFHVRDGVFEYLSGWPLLEGIETDVTFRNFSMAISADRARIQGLRVGPVAVTIPDLGAHEATTLQIGGQATGTVSALVEALRNADLHHYTRHLSPALRAEGNGDLSLAIHFPTHAPHDLRMKGRYEIHAVNMYSIAPGFDLTGLDGAVEFSESGAVGGAIQGHALGGAFNASFHPPADKNGGKDIATTGSMHAQGSLVAANLQPWLGPLTPSLRGNVPWQLALTPSGDNFAINFDADLRGLDSELPPPFAKPVGEPQHLSLRSTSASHDTREFALALDRRLHAALRYTRAPDDSFVFDRGQVAVGALTVPATLPGEPGLQLAVRLPELNIAPWAPFWKRSVTRGPDPARKPSASPLMRLDAQLGALNYGSSKLGRFDLDLRRVEAGDNSRWSGRVDGDLATGAVEWRTAGGNGSLVATLDKLSIASAPGALREPPEAVADAGAIDPASLPAVTISSPDLRWQGRRVGNLALQAHPGGGQWRIERLRIADPHYSIAAEGEWIADAAGNRTRLRSQTDTSDFGAFLTSMGLPGRVEGGHMQSQSSWEWPGSPYEFKLAHLTGNLTMDARSGRLPSVGEGAGRLFGAFDLRALPRYLQLDFSGLFSKGFQFDSLIGAASVVNGKATINNVVMKGPAADIQINGGVGLAARDYDMSITVTPRIGEAPTIAGALLGGPVGAAAVVVAKEVFKKPLAAGTRVTYDITGSWDAPRIERRREPSLSKVPDETPAQQ